MAKAKAKRSGSKHTPAKHLKVVKSKSHKAARGGSGSGKSKGKAPHVAAKKKHGAGRGKASGRQSLGKSRARQYRFVQAPPRGAMKKRAPESAPRLFEWLVDNGYVESVSSYRSKRPRR